jgi:glycerol-3-phosphate dehydrogenase (NAD(P)+)
VICAKGIERGTDALMSEAVAEALPECVPAVLSGPTFAIEVARGLPTAVTLACVDEALGRRIVAAVGQPHFRPYWSADVTGAQIGGALKNVIAIACGIVEGRRLGENARAALMTRGLAEMLRFGRVKGARMETLMGLSGLGDLALTCNSARSRNMSLGIALGQGGKADAILANRPTVTEGVATAAAVARAAREIGVEIPIAAAVDRICNDDAEIEAEIGGLLARPFTIEGI